MVKVRAACLGWLVVEAAMAFVVASAALWGVAVLDLTTGLHWPTLREALLGSCLVGAIWPYFLLPRTALRLFRVLRSGKPALTSELDRLSRLSIFTFAGYLALPMAWWFYRAAVLTSGTGTMLSGGDEALLTTISLVLPWLFVPGIVLAGIEKKRASAKSHTDAPRLDRLREERVRPAAASSTGLLEDERRLFTEREAIAPPPGFDSIALAGVGATSRVYCARHVGRNTVLALKRMRRQLFQDAEALARLRRELIALSRLDHPSIVRVHDVFSWDGDPTVVMEYVAGEDLKHRIKRLGALPAEELERVARALFEAVDTAHAAGIVHRDVKPQNVRVTPEGRIVLLDFGSARLDAASQLTVTGTSVGTPEYMAPELFSGPVYDPRADIYGVGATLFESATGAPPHTADSLAELAYRSTAEDAPRVRERAPGVPESIAQVIDRSLSRSPDARYASAALALWALDHPIEERVFCARRSAHPPCLHCSRPIPPESKSCIHCGSARPFAWSSGRSRVVIESVSDPRRFIEHVLTFFPEKATPAGVERLAEETAALAFGRRRFASFIARAEAEQIAERLRGAGASAMAVTSRPGPRALFVACFGGPGLLGGRSPSPQPDLWARIRSALGFGGGESPREGVAKESDRLRAIAVAFLLLLVPLELNGLLVLSKVDYAEVTHLFEARAKPSAPASPRPDHSERAVSELAVAHVTIDAPELVTLDQGSIEVHVRHGRNEGIFRENARILWMGEYHQATRDREDDLRFDLPIRKKTAGQVLPIRLAVIKYVREGAWSGDELPVFVPAQGVSQIRIESTADVAEREWMSALDKSRSSAWWLAGALFVLWIGVGWARRRAIRSDRKQIVSELDARILAEFGARTPPLVRFTCARAANKTGLDLLPRTERDPFLHASRARMASLSLPITGDALRSLARTFADIGAREPGAEAAEDSFRTRCILETDPEQSLRFRLLALEGQLEAQAAETWARRLQETRGAARW